MAEQRKEAPANLGIYDRSRKDRTTGVELVAFGLACAWILICGGYFLIFAGTSDTGAQTSNFMLILLTIFVPVAMIWVGIVAGKSARVMREESKRLQVAIDAMRNAYVAQAQQRHALEEPTVSKKLEELTLAQQRTEMALSGLAAQMRAPSPTPAAVAGPKPAEAEIDDQVALPLGTPLEDLQPPVATSDFIRALNFPETAEDREGFAALRRALKDRQSAQLIQAAQDVLTLLSKDGIYMDDLRPDLARPEVWRRFAGGERGRSIAGLGGIRDRSSLALSAARMKNDPIFRDAAHHFLRIYDRMVSDFADTATDAELTELSNTRTSRAFMLLGRVTGTFD